MMLILSAIGACVVAAPTMPTIRRPMRGYSIGIEARISVIRECWKEALS